MLELTLGALAAALIAKALDRAEGKALDRGEGMLKKLVELVRGSSSSDECSAALDRLEKAPDSPSRVNELARQLDERVAADPEFGDELEALVEEAKAGSVDVQSIVQVAYGDQSPQLSNVSDSEINISYGSGGGPGRPRRISD